MKPFLRIAGTWTARTGSAFDNRGQATAVTFHFLSGNLAFTARKMATILHQWQPTLGRP